MGSPRRTPTDQELEQLEQRFNAFCDDYDVLKEDVESIYQTFYDSLTNTYNTLRHELDRRPTEESIRNEIERVETGHHRYVARLEEDLNKIDQSGLIEKYSSLLNNINIINRIDENTRNLQALKAESDATRNPVTKLSLLAQIATLERQNQSFLTRLETILSENSDIHVKSETALEDSYQVAVMLRRHCTNEINRIAQERYRISDWLSKKDQHLQDELDRINRRKTDSDEFIQHLHSDISGRLNVLLEKIEAIKQRRVLIASTKERLQEVEAYVIPPGSETGRIAKKIKDRLDIMERSKESIIQSYNDEFASELNALFNEYNEKISADVKKRFTTLVNTVNDSEDRFIRMDMMGETRAAIRAMIQNRIEESMQTQLEGIKTLIVQNKIKEASHHVENAEKAWKTLEETILEKIHLDTPKVLAAKSSSAEQNENDQADLNEKVTRQKIQRSTRLNERTRELLQLLMTNHPSLREKISDKQLQDPEFLKSFREAIENKKSIKLLKEGFRIFGQAGLTVDSFTIPGEFLSDNHKKQIRLSEQEKALIGVIFTPERDRKAREEIYSELTKTRTTPGKTS